MTTLLISTRNAHKMHEIRAILGEQFRYVDLTRFPNAPEVVEDTGTFAGNASKKSIELARWLAGSAPGDPGPRITYVLADDSGLEVDTLNDAPGVHSARFAALDMGRPGNSTAAENNAKLLRLLSGVAHPKRTARFRCVIALTPALEPAPATASPVCAADEFELQTELFEGTCEGQIEFEPKGTGGFGYDPLFTPLGFEQTFGQLSETIKNQLSHRAKALAKLKQRLDR